MGFILWILAKTLELPLFFVGFFFEVYDCFHRIRIRQGFRNLDARFLLLAKTIDKHGNVACASLFNRTLIKRRSTHSFGTFGETISYVIGKNIQLGTLTWAGSTLNAIFDFFDPNHSLNAVKQYESIDETGGT